MPSYWRRPLSPKSCRLLAELDRLCPHRRGSAPAYAPEPGAERARPRFTLVSPRAPRDAGAPAWERDHARTHA